MAPERQEPPPSYRCYTPAEGAARIGGRATANLLEELATRGYEHTLIGNKVHYTDAQLGAVIAAHARGKTVLPEEPAEDPAAPVVEPTPLPATRSRRATRTAAASKTDLTATPGRRYSA
ncbi:hypothetical protein [Nonomuraea antri]|uniref:hypothetical protein n=1 Tax=Nonomuraea antri TaxID=2730852 RepID=UPI001F3F133A|nr:hypothetical protein [Nonomuraea antri]